MCVGNAGKERTEQALCLQCTRLHTNTQYSSDVLPKAACLQQYKHMLRHLKSFHSSVSVWLVSTIWISFSGDFFFITEPGSTEFKGQVYPQCYLAMKDSFSFYLSRFFRYLSNIFCLHLKAKAYWFVKMVFAIRRTSAWCLTCSAAVSFFPLTHHHLIVTDWRVPTL